MEEKMEHVSSILYCPAINGKHIDFEYPFYRKEEALDFSDRLFNDAVAVRVITAEAYNQAIEALKACADKDNAMAKETLRTLGEL